MKLKSKGKGQSQYEPKLESQKYRRIFRKTLLQDLQELYRDEEYKSAMSTTGYDARSPLASPLLYETLREGRRLANASLSALHFYVVPPQVLSLTQLKTILTIPIKS